MDTIAHAPDTGTELLSVRRTATRLGIHRGTTYKLIRRGELPAVRVGGSIRVDPLDLENYLAERRVTT